MAEPSQGPGAPVAAIVLAAGRSTRMGSANKLLCEVAGAPIVRHVAAAALGSRARHVLVVTGHQAEAVRAALAGLTVTFVANPDYASGLMSSLKAGIAALPGGIAGALVALGDMPLLRPADFDRLIEAFLAAGTSNIIVPVHGGRRGNPVLWSRRFFPDLMAIEGDVGARHLIGRYGEAVAEVPVDGKAVLVDIDTPEALLGVKAEIEGAFSK